MSVPLRSVLPQRVGRLSKTPAFWTFSSSVINLVLSRKYWPLRRIVSKLDEPYGKCLGIGLATIALLRPAKTRLAKPGRRSTLHTQTVTRRDQQQHQHRPQLGRAQPRAETVAHEGNDALEFVKLHPGFRRLAAPSWGARLLDFTARGYLPIPRPKPQTNMPRDRVANLAGGRRSPPARFL